MLNKRRVWGIYRDTLEMLVEMAKSNYPKEFVALLRHENGIISEVLLLPGTLQGEDSATIMLYMRPVDLSVVGSVHCHPGPSHRPSGADLDMFRHFGHTHIILSMPYDMSNWRAYDHEGNRIELEIVDE